MQPTPNLPIFATVERSAPGVLETGDRIEIRPTQTQSIELERVRGALKQKLFDRGERREAVIGEIDHDGQPLTLIAVRSRKNRRKILGVLIDESRGTITAGEWTADEDGKGDDDLDATPAHV